MKFSINGKPYDYIPINSLNRAEIETLITILANQADIYRVYGDTVRGQLSNGEPVIEEIKRLAGIKDKLAEALRKG